MPCKNRKLDVDKLIGVLLPATKYAAYHLATHRLFQSKAPFYEIFFTCWGVSESLLSQTKTNVFRSNVSNYPTDCKVMSALTEHRSWGDQ